MTKLTYFIYRYEQTAEVVSNERVYAFFFFLKGKTLKGINPEKLPLPILDIIMIDYNVIDYKIYVLTASVTTKGGRGGRKIVYVSDTERINPATCRTS